MKAYLAVKFHPDHCNRQRIERVCAALEQAGIQSVCVIRDLERWGEIRFEPGDLMRASLALLERCDVVVVELSEKGVGVGIEAGYAYAKGIPVITVAQAGADISDTLRGISREVFSYRDDTALKNFFSERLSPAEKPQADGSFQGFSTIGQSPTSGGW